MPKTRVVALNGNAGAFTSITSQLACLPPYCGRALPPCDVKLDDVLANVQKATKCRYRVGFGNGLAQKNRPGPFGAFCQRPPLRLRNLKPITTQLRCGARQDVQVSELRYKIRHWRRIGSFADRVHVHHSGS